MKKKSNISISGFTLVEGLVLIAIMLSLVVVFIIRPLMESRTYNKLTGANTTWWDAIWVELRVQDQPNK